MKKAFVVSGPESSGNKYLVSLLCSAGCLGRSNIKQPFDDHNCLIKLPEQHPNLMTFYRSLPHGNVWPDLLNIIIYLRRNGYYVTLLIPIRDQNIIEKSQVKNGHVNNIYEARHNIKSAFNLLSAVIHITNVNTHYVIYQSLAKENYVKWLFDQLQLELNYQVPFVDGDLKYYLQNKQDIL